MAVTATRLLHDLVKPVLQPDLVKFDAAVRPLDAGHGDAEFDPTDEQLRALSTEALERIGADDEWLREKFR